MFTVNCCHIGKNKYLQHFHSGSVHLLLLHWITVSFPLLLNKHLAHYQDAQGPPTTDCGCLSQPANTLTVVKSG